ncbi:MAG: peptidylprolyl isomerase [Planctomycetota bacterium]|jgi:peptidyl-prolyl cis-trans isomerase A (cyclophilin A)
MRILVLLLLPVLATSAGEADVGALAELLDSVRPTDRYRAAHELRAMGPEAAAARRALIDALGDAEPWVRMEAGRALVRVGLSAKEVTLLIRRFERADPAVAQLMAEALAGLGEPAVDALLDALESDEHKSRLYALTALRFIGPAAAAAVPMALDLTSDENAALRHEAENVLRRLGPWSEEYVPEILERLQLGDQRTQWLAIGLLGRVGPAAKEAISELQRILRDGSERMKNAAAQALKTIDVGRAEQPRHPALKDPGRAKEKAPETFKVRFETTRGPIEVEILRAWSPHGADRFYNLVRIGYFEDAALFRVIKGFVAQFGLHADSAVANVWKRANIPDDPVKQPNRRGTLTYAMAGPGTRSTQLFFNLGDNAHLDGQKFAPIGRISKGMEVLSAIHSGYGDQPDQMSLLHEGNAYLKREYPKLDYIKRVILLK